MKRERERGMERVREGEGKSECKKERKWSKSGRNKNETKQ